MPLENGMKFFLEPPLELPLLNLWHMHPIYFLLWRREGYSYQFVSEPQLRAGLHSSVKMLFHKYLKYFEMNQINLIIQFRIKLIFLKNCGWQEYH